MKNKKTKPDSRLLALDILCELTRKKTPLDVILDRCLSRAALADSRDKNLIMALSYGVTRQRRYLDWIIRAVASYPLEKMKPRTINALRLGVLQIFFMDKIPASAAINETIMALKKSKQPKWLTNFCNGVLRNIDRKQQELRVTAEKEMTAAERLSHPDWLVKRWQKRFGAAGTESICRINNTLPSLALNINQQKTSAEAYLKILTDNKIKGYPGKFSANCIHLDYRGAIKNLPGYREGLFHVQDEAAQLVGDFFRPMVKGNYLDCCAGLGGKTMQLAAMIPPGSRLFAVEPQEGRVKQLEINLKRLEMMDKISIFAMDLEQFAKQTETVFNYILVDAPCSGLGVIRRHPDIRWNRQPQDLIVLQQTQLKLLDIAAGLLAPDGVLVYATCTTEPEENDEVVSRFLSLHPKIKTVQPTLPGKASGFVDKNNFFRAMPAADHDGFFAAEFLKKW